MPRALTVGEIDQVVADFAAAAARAVQAGVDVISVHGAHGYLIAQFLSPRSNHRSDEYRQPTAFLNRVVTAVRAEIGESVPLFLRLSAFEGLDGGLDQEQSLTLAGTINLDVVDVLDLSAGTYGAGHWITPSGEVEEGYLAPVARRYRRYGRLVSVAGRITTPATAHRIITEQSADLVVVGRALHADPTWPRHAIAGTAPRPCISCNQGCADVIHSGAPLWCAVNPDTGFEGRPATRSSAPSGRLLVIGGGPAGLEAATTAARHGLRVRLVERADQVGGQLALAAELRGKPQFRQLLNWYGSSWRGSRSMCGPAWPRRAKSSSSGSTRSWSPPEASDTCRRSPAATSHESWRCATGCGGVRKPQTGGSPSGAPTGSECSSPTSWLGAATRSSWSARSPTWHPTPAPRETAGRPAAAHGPQRHHPVACQRRSHRGGDHDL